MIKMIKKAAISKEQIEKRAFTKQLNEILDYFKKIDAIDTSNIEPTFHVIDLVNVLRDDKVEPSLSKTDALKNAPQKEGSFIKAPKIL
jgi:aspartyl-tRNA(Asn)/glutamyl-tRNA(Gln) amidotransferase subunit C